jgi:hypothetical protein
LVPPVLEPPEVLPPEVVLLFPPEVDELLPPPEVLELLLDLVDLLNFVDFVDLEKKDLLKKDFVEFVFWNWPDLELLKKKAFASVGVTAATEVVATAALTIAALVSFRYCICLTLFPICTAFRDVLFRFVMW